MHNIDENDIQEGLVQAWHGLTTICLDLSLQKNNLREWDIEHVPVYVRVGDLYVPLVGVR